MSDKQETKARGASVPSDADWFVRMSNGAVFGPINTKGLVHWARDGRIMPDDEISTDRVAWRPARELPELEIDTMIELPDGTFIGPYNANAIEPLVKEGKIPPKAKRFHADELEERIAVRQATLFADEADEGEAAPPAGGIGGVEGMAAEKIRGEFEERIADLKRQSDDVIAEYERAQENLQAEFEKSKNDLKKSQAELRKTQAELGDTRVELGKIQAELEDARGDPEKVQSELDAARAELKRAQAELEEARAELLKARGASDDFGVELNNTKRELEEARDKLEKTIRELDETAVELNKKQGELDAISGELEKSRAGLEKANEISEENLRLRHDLEESEIAFDALSKSSVDENEFVGLVSENASLKNKLDEVQSQMDELQGEFNELLAFSNERDAEAKDKIRDLTDRLEARDASADVVVDVDDTMAGDGLLGSQRVMNNLKSRLGEATRECEELRSALADANARATSAGRPSEGDFATIKLFANGALDLLRKTLEEEKERNTAARAASADMQNALHGEIGKLERIMMRDPGEISRTEQAAMRSERQTAKLQQELESVRRHHQADMARADANEKALEGRCKALAQKEALLREKLSRLEQRAADYDSQTNQLRRKESALLAAEKEFEEARQQWQIIESSLMHRIDELEKGSGLLFASDGTETAGEDPEAKPMKSVEPKASFKGGPHIRLMK